MEENLQGERPRQVLADTGYYSEEHVNELQQRGIDPYLAAGRMKHHEKPAPPRGRRPRNLTTKQRMARKLQTIKGRATYARRKAIVEPVFAQIKQARGLRGFLPRGLDKVSAEWLLMCTTHNLLKLAGARRRPATG
jgi:IS5 family transposase